MFRIDFFTRQDEQPEKLVESVETFRLNGRMRERALEQTDKQRGQDF
jgi:hypothetical protein